MNIFKVKKLLNLTFNRDITSSQQSTLIEVTCKLKINARLLQKLLNTKQGVNCLVMSL